MLVKLSDEVSVNPSYITSMEITDRGVILITMYDGKTHGIVCDYGSQIWQTADRIRGLING